MGTNPYEIRAVRFPRAADLALTVGCSAATISRLERGRFRRVGNRRRDLLRKLLEVVGQEYVDAILRIRRSP